MCLASFTSVLPLSCRLYRHVSNRIRAACFFMTVGFLVSESSDLRGNHPVGRLELNETTRALASSLRHSILNPMNAVRDSETELQELARIPDPESFQIWKLVLLNPRAFASPVRQVAARTLGTYEGVNDASAAEITSASP